MSNPRDERAAAREARQHHLSLPRPGAGRANPIRSRSPSPSNLGSFQFPPLPPSPRRSSKEVEEEQFRDALSLPLANNMPDLSVDDIVRIATASAQAAAREMAAAAALSLPTPATAETPAASQTPKKVELPPFDKKNIHTWIRRVEAAFGRAGVIQPKDKFFFIEAKLDVNINPKINEFLCGESNEAKWDEFLQYLQEEYGRTKEQQASLFLSGIAREGLRPTQHLAKIKDLTKDISLDDLIKEMLLKDLPKSIRQTLAERTTLSAEETAKAADHYFDKDGRPKHEVDPPRINNIDEPADATETDDDGDQINAVGRSRFRGNRGGNHRSRPPQRTNTSNYSDPPKKYVHPNAQRSSTRPNKPSTLQQICKAHVLYGEKAYSCEPGCQFRKQQQQQQQNRPAGNEPAGRRK